jgi:hypothetical protein
MIRRPTNEALALPSEARALLADRLVESLDPAEDGYIHELCVSEARFRLQELRWVRLRLSLEPRPLLHSERSMLHDLRLSPGGPRRI